MNVIATGRSSKTVEIQLSIQGIGDFNVPVQVVDNLSTVLPKADFISLHVPKQPNGEAVLGKAEFDLMKNGVQIVNAARGGVVDETALLEAIASGKVAFAGLDVFENEPNPRADLLNNDAIATTPHIGAATGEAQDRIGLELASLIIAEFGKQVPA